MGGVVEQSKRSDAVAVRLAIHAAFALCLASCSSHGGRHAALAASDARNACSIENARANVVAAVHRFADAFRSGDVPTVDALLHERYVHTNGANKSTDRRAWVAWFTSRSQKIKNGELAVLEYDMSDLDVEVVSDVAVVTGLVQSTTQTSGATEHSRIRFTNVWVCGAGQWKRLAFHDAPAADAGR